MVWAILTNRHEIAYLAWTRVTNCIHGALFACYLYNLIGEHVGGEGGGEGRGGEGEGEGGRFEGLAVDILEKFRSFERAKGVLEWKWRILGEWNALKIARYVNNYSKIYFM